MGRDELSVEGEGDSSLGAGSSGGKEVNKIDPLIQTNCPHQNQT